MAERAISVRRAMLQLVWFYCALLIYIVRNIFRGNFGKLSSFGSAFIVTFAIVNAVVFKRTEIRIDEVLIRRLVPTFLLHSEAIGHTLRYVWITLIVLALMIIVLLVLPPLVPFVTDYIVSPTAIAFVASNRVEMKAWLDFSIISFEVAIAVCIGGAAFSEGLANRIRGQLRDWQIAYAQTGEKTVEKGVSKTVQVANHVKTIHTKLQQFDFQKAQFGNTVEFYLQVMGEADLVTDDIENLLLRDYPKIVRTMVTTSLISSFPGGIYGMIAFTLFCCLMVAKVTYIYISGVV